MRRDAVAVAYSSGVMPGSVPWTIRHAAANACSPVISPYVAADSSRSASLATFGW
ncbi:hypothetical protein [Streptomyces sp. 11-1-2]|uniref:hypothetical protein n=1 Tax=Streptomyces sp. 11-1-2 TaxID=1851167 RepID=UPI0013C4B843|nr:hypothetical protein [Streptomyces sp. 11-1-2]